MQCPHCKHNLDIELNTANQLLNEMEKVWCERKERTQDDGIFNIFEILHLERKEAETHSNMLYNILNPNADHTMNGQF